MRPNNYFNLVFVDFLLKPKKGFYIIGTCLTSALMGQIDGFA
jgi:hypothetical protein